MQQRTVIAFMEIVDPYDADNSIRFHTGIGNPYPTGSRWSVFLGVGGLMSISTLRENTRTASSGFQISLSLPAEADRDSRAAILRESLRLDIADRDLVLWVLSQPPGAVLVNDEFEASNHTSAAYPELVMLSRIGTPDITPREVRLSCYTASSQMDRPYGAPVLWNDYQQKELLQFSFFETPEGQKAIVKEMVASSSDWPTALATIKKRITEDSAFQFATYEFSNSGVSFP